MSIFGGIIINATYILFPLTIYLIYSAYTKNLDLKEKSICLFLIPKILISDKSTGIAGHWRRSALSSITLSTDGEVFL